MYLPAPSAVPGLTVPLPSNYLFEETSVLGIGRLPREARAGLKSRTIWPAKASFNQMLTMSCQEVAYVTYLEAITTLTLTGSAASAASRPQQFPSQRFDFLPLTSSRSTEQLRLSVKMPPGKLTVPPGPRCRPVSDA